MIRFSNGHELDFACAAGALAFDGHGWPHEWPLRWLGIIRPEEMTFVTKTLTWDERVGNFKYYWPFRSVRYLGGGSFVNAIGNTNPGLPHWYMHIRRKITAKCYAVSVEPHSIQEAGQMIQLLNLIPDFQIAYIELNASCPNTAGVGDLLAMIEAMKCGLIHPLVVKLSYQQAMDNALVSRIPKYVEAIHAINTVPWATIYPDKVSPLAKALKINGGVSGPPIKKYALEAIQNVRACLPEMPIIGGGGLSTFSDTLDYEAAGSSAFSIGSLFIRAPWMPNRIIKRYRDSEKLMSLMSQR